MRRVWPIAALLVASAIAWGSVGLAGALAAPTAGPRAYVVIATGLTWSDIDATATPALFKLASTGAIGNLNAKPRGYDDPPSAFEGALELSAGNWVTPEYAAAAPYNVTETVGSGTASQVYQRVTGASTGDAAIAFLGIPPATKTASVTADDVVLGTLGQSVDDARGSTVAIGNSDAGDTTATMKVMRPAALAAMNAQGLVSFGDVSQDLLVADPNAPYGVRTDAAALGQALSAAEASVSAHGGPALIVLDPGDSYRAARYATQVDTTIATAERAAALRNLDEVVALAVSHASASDVVIVAGQGPPVDPATGVQGFSPILASGSGIQGFLTSSSTHRGGMVANPDITATVLGRLGIARPVQVIGSDFRVDDAPADGAARIAQVSTVSLTVESIDSVRGSFFDSYPRIFAVLLVLVAALVAFRGRLKPLVSQRMWRRLVGALKAASLALVCVLTGGWLMFLITPTLSSPAAATVSLLAASAFLLAAAGVAWRYAGPRTAPALIALVTVALLAGDQFLGAPLSRVNLLGYTPLQAARYYGIGNEAAAFVLGCAIVGLALAADEWPHERFSRTLCRFGLPVVGAVVIVAAAAPTFGANFGVAIWGTVGLLVAWMGLNGRRITWKTAVIALVVIAVLIGGFALVDVFGGGAQTHLARSLSTAEQGGISQLGLIIQRKADTNARVFTQTTWWVLPLLTSLAFLAFIRLRPGTLRDRLLAENPAFVSAVWAGLAAGAVALFTEDTGILIITVVLLPLAAAAVWLVLTTSEASEQGR